MEYQPQLDLQSIEPGPRIWTRATASEPAYFYTGRRFSPVALGRDADEGRSSDEQDIYDVRIIDNDYNTYDQVIRICMSALGITQAQAFAVAWEVDHYGSCAVAQGPYEEAEAVAGVIRTIGIEVHVNPVVSVEG